jgi:hypothetical protein
MNYFQAYLPSLDESIVAAWDSQILDAADTPWLAQALATKSAELFPRFASSYAQLRKLPRGARRALQRQLARSCGLSIPLEWQRKLAGSLAGAALLLALGQGVAQAGIITVNTTNPAVIPGDNKCSLTEAINSANNDAPDPDCPSTSPLGNDTIVLPKKKTIKLTTVNNSIYGDTGLPVITSSITITGNGAKLARKSNAPAFRILAVGYQAGLVYGDLTLDKVTISGGSSTDRGAGILNYGTLAVTNKSVITGNKSGNNGGGIFNFGSLNVTNSTISKNRASNGGAIYNDGNSSSYGTFALVGSTVSGNAAFSGGGIFNRAYGQGSVDTSTVSGNVAKLYNDGYNFSAGVGGGVFNAGALVVTNGTIRKNAAYYGGGFHNDASGDLYIQQSTVSGNTAKHKLRKVAGYFYSYGGFGGGIDNRGSLEVTQSTISGNKALGKLVRYKYSYYGYTYIILQPFGGTGGGLFNNASAVVNSSDIKENRASMGGGGIANAASLDVANSDIMQNRSLAGGGVVNIGDFYLTNSSITGNTASLVGGGVLNTGSSYSFTDVNNIITGNQARLGPNVYYYGVPLPPLP